MVVRLLCEAFEAGHQNVIMAIVQYHTKENILLSSQSQMSKWHQILLLCK